MDYFKVDAKKTIIFEDSNVGIMALEASGASVMIVDKFLIEVKDEGVIKKE